MIAGGLLQLAAPIYAAGVAAGADISNTATASYEDPNAPGTPLNTISNTVNIKVEKIAGIFVTDEGATDVTNPGQYKPGDIVNFDFKITNKGNSAVQFSIPGQAVVSTAGDFQEVQYFNPAVGPSGDWVTVVNGSAAIPAEIVPVDGFIKARVVVKIRSTALANEALTVEFGKTAQTPTPGNPTLNVSRSTSPETPDSGDIYTVDVTNGAIDPSNGLATPGGAAINGIRESAAFQSVSVQAVKKAFVDINMTGSSPVPDPTDPSVTKNKITYDINVKVDPSAPTSGPDANKNPSDLGATAVKIAQSPTDTVGTSENHVLISDPVPTNTTPTLLTAPTGWTAVYSTSPVGTPQDQIVWTKVTTTPLPDTIGTVKFVGFIKNDDKALPKSSTPYAGFQVVVQTTGASLTTPTTFSNVVDVIGSTPLNTGLADPNSPIQDQTGTAAPDTPTGGTPIVTTITPLVGNLSVFNGPLTKPQASGADGSKNTDFTNKSAEIKTTDAVRLGGVLQTVTPTTVSFGNTVENKGSAATDIYLLPTAPAVLTDLPTDTLVKLSYLSEDRTYKYNSGTGKFTPIAADAGKVPLVIPNLAKDGTAVYGVAVTLPGGVAQLKGYTAPVTAFADTAPTTAATTTANDGSIKLPDTVTGANSAVITGSKNTTIDTVYTGYIDLMKEARILNNASDANSATPAFSSGTLTAKPKPGQYIQYRIKYTNISNNNGASGSGNTVLNAGKLNIIEDGKAGTNTWGDVTTHSPNSALDTSGGTVLFNNGTLTNNDPLVTKYVVDMNAAGVIIAPQDSGNFSFLRQVK
jgi:hypothetical protein